MSTVSGKEFGSYFLCFSRFTSIRTVHKALHCCRMMFYKCLNLFWAHTVTVVSRSSCLFRLCQKMDQRRFDRFILSLKLLGALVHFLSKDLNWSDTTHILIFQIQSLLVCSCNSKTVCISKILPNFSLFTINPSGIAVEIVLLYGFCRERPS